MGFHDIRLTTEANFGAAFGPTFLTEVVELRSGQEERIQRYSGAGRHAATLDYTNRTEAQKTEALDFFIARGGKANSFRLKDWSDYSTGSNHTGAVDDEDVEIASGDGSTTTFQLLKKYSSGGVTVSRNIYLPIESTVVVAVDSVAQTLGVDFTVNDTAGTITFASAPANATSITAGFEFDVQARFDTDEMPISIENFSTRGFVLPVIEVVDETPDPEIGWNGGSKDFGTTSIAQTVTLANGRALRFSPSTAHDVNLPDAVNIAAGGPIFFIVNDGGSASLTLKYSDESTTAGTVAAGARAELWLVENASSGLKEWQLT